MGIAVFYERILKQSKFNVLDSVQYALLSLLHAERLVHAEEDSELESWLPSFANVTGFARILEDCSSISGDVVDMLLRLQDSKATDRFVALLFTCLYHFVEVLLENQSILITWKHSLLKERRIFIN